jgi:hypothetical protein
MPQLEERGFRVTGISPTANSSRSSSSRPPPVRRLPIHPEYQSPMALTPVPSLRGRGQGP